MDNTDRIKEKVLTKKLVNTQTGETITRTKPIRKKRQRIIVASGRGRKSVGNIMLAKVQPLKFAIITLLKKRGYDTSMMNFRTLVATYYREFVKTDFDIQGFVNNIGFKLSPDDETIGDISETRNALQFTEIPLIVEGVINTFVHSKQKFDTCIMQGFDPEMSLKDEEITQAKACIIIQEKLLRKEKEDHFLKADDLKGVYWLIGFICVVWLLSQL